MFVFFGMRVKIRTHNLYICFFFPLILKSEYQKTASVHHLKIHNSICDGKTSVSHFRQTATVKSDTS